MRDSSCSADRRFLSCLIHGAGRIGFVELGNENRHHRDSPVAGIDHLGGIPALHTCVQQLTYKGSEIYRKGI